MSKIKEMINKIELFQYSTSIDLNMWYYHIRLIENIGDIYKIILPQANYRYKKLPMGVCNSPQKLQVKMNEISKALM